MLNGKGISGIVGESGCKGEPVLNTGWLIEPKSNSFMVQVTSHLINI